MRLKDVLEQYRFSSEITEVFLSSGINTLYPPQAAAITHGVLEGKNVVMSVPTAAGKTLIAELTMIHAITRNNGRCLYIAPLKALASEKFKDFKKKYAPLGIQVGLAIGDLDTPSRYLNRYQILVATAEKVDSLLRHKAQWLINALQVVILDEIHFINDGERGPTLEILTARIRQFNPSIQILALSATVRNANEIAGWLKGEAVVSQFRPIPLKEGVYFNERILFDKYGVRLVQEEESEDLNKLALDTLRGRGQILIFVNSRRSAQAASVQIAPTVNKILKAEERKELMDIAKKIVGSPGEATKICRKLSGVITHGAAFHHAGLKPQQRELIEENFKKNLIKVICCTPTLAAGVNLPARRAIIRDIKRYESGIGQAYIPTSEYKQCAGRAGRPQYDDFGEAVIMAKTLSEQKTLFEKYIHAQPEPIISKLGSEGALRIHILASIAGGYVHDVNGMFEFMTHTFLHHQKGIPDLLGLLGDIFDFLHREQFIEKSGYRFFATAFGNLTSRLYIDPASSIVLRDGLNLVDPEKPFSPAGILELICACPDSPLLNVGKNDLEALEKFANHSRDALLLHPENWPGFSDLYSFLATIKTTWMLYEWCAETKEEVICDQFGVGPGDVYRHIESCTWLLYAAGMIAELFHRKALTFSLEGLRQRVKYGVKEELLDLVQLKGVGRIRARNLFEKGWRTLADMDAISAEELEKIPQIGKGLAQDIIKQIRAPSSSKLNSLREGLS